MNPRVLTTIALCSATLTLITTAAPAAAAVTNANQPRISRAEAADNSIKPFVSVDLSQENPVDSTKNITGIKTIGKKGSKPMMVADRTLDGKFASFDGSSAYALPITNDMYSKFQNKGITIEAFFKYTGPSTDEHDVLSNQQGGGLGLGVSSGMLTLFANDEKNGEKQLKADMEIGKWVHAVGVFDVVSKKTRLYLNGKLVKEVENDGHLKLPSAAANNFVIGGDSGNNDALQFGMEGKIKTANIYNESLSADKIKSLSDASLKEVHAPASIIEQAFDTELIGSADAVVGHTYILNVHTRQVNDGDINRLQYDVTFDPEKLEYTGVAQTLGGGKTTVEKVNDTTLRVTSKAKLSSVEFRKFAQTRLAQLKFKAKNTNGQSVQTGFRVTNANASIDDKAVSKLDMQIENQQNITIHSKNINDYNGDGIVGVGDVALAPNERKAAVAKAAVIRPYKHVIVLTTDGGGNPWDPNGMYYTTSNSILPKWTKDKSILKKRQNTYTMDLFNNKFAMSTSAHSVKPSISAQNYSSMLHGLPWGEMDSEYKMTNDTAGQQYFADFGKSTPKYPSIFKTLSKNNPAQGMAAFAEWAPILNGITEPDAAVETAPSKAWGSFDDVANYIDSDKFNDTSLVYMQSDQMDHQGHGNGWYNDAYWAQYKRYDSEFKKVMDKLEKTGHIHDTLVIANADHGGSAKSHGSMDPSNMDIFLALGGETIDAGRKLNGGSNADISPLILKALQVEQPSTMTGKVFDSSAFLDQTELVKKHRQVESINLKNGQNKFDLQFKANGNSQVRTLDTRIDLAGQTIDKVTVPAGAKVLRQDVENGILKLTLSFDKQPAADMATVTLKAGKTKAAAKVTIKQAMIGTDKGAEVLPDITTDATAKQPEPGKPAPSTPGNGGSVTTPSTPGTNSGSATTKPTKPAKPNTETNATASESHKAKPAKKNKLKGKIVYAQKKVGFYKKAKFTKKNRYKFFTAKPQNKWAQFKIVTKKGNRYQVKDINKGSKTYGKTGYITSSSKYVTSADYTKKPIKVKVINAKGLSAYDSKTLKGKHTTYKRGTMLKIKKLVKSKGKLRLQLKNGKYITVDKHMIHAYFAHK